MYQRMLYSFKPKLNPMDEEKVALACHQVTLIIKYLKGELTEEDRIELHQFINSKDCNYLVFEDLTDHLEVITGLIDLQEYLPGSAWLKFRQKLG